MSRHSWKSWHSLCFLQALQGESKVMDHSAEVFVVNRVWNHHSHKQNSTHTYSREDNLVTDSKDDCCISSLSYLHSWLSAPTPPYNTLLCSAFPEGPAKTETRFRFQNPGCIHLLMNPVLLLPYSNHWQLECLIHTGKSCGKWLLLCKKSAMSITMWKQPRQSVGRRESKGLTLS